MFSLFSPCLPFVLSQIGAICFSLYLFSASFALLRWLLSPAPRDRCEDSALAGDEARSISTFLKILILYLINQLYPHKRITKL